MHLVPWETKIVFFWVFAICVHITSSTESRALQYESGCLRTKRQPQHPGVPYSFLRMWCIQHVIANNWIVSHYDWLMLGGIEGGDVFGGGYAHILQKKSKYLCCASWYQHQKEAEVDVDISVTLLGQECTEESHSFTLPRTG